MKKFDVENELKKVKSNKKISNNSRMSNMFVPLLVVACCSLALVGVAFSSKLTNDSLEKHNITIEIIGGKDERYTKEVYQGAFRDSLEGNGTFGSMTCLSGNLTYDPFTETISSPYVNEDIKCVLSFMDDGTKNIEFGKLNSISDNFGTSYYYKADAKNNYVRINNLMFRIVRINGTGSIRLVLNKEIGNVTYGNTVNFYSSNVYKELLNWYDANLKGIDYIVEDEFDDSNYEGYFTNDLIVDKTFTLAKVGTLNVREVAIITEGVEGSNYLDSKDGIYLMNGHGYDMVHFYKEGNFGLVNPNTTLSVRPVINISGVELVGQGTLDNPYTIEK